MLYTLGRLRLSIVTTLVALAGTPRAQGAIELQWRPTLSSSVVGDVLEIGLYAVSDSGLDQPIAGLELVFEWDTAQLLLLVNVDPCTADPCPANTYNWIESSFPDDSARDGLNNTFTDGIAFYIAFIQPGTPAMVTPEGLFVTAFRFGILEAGVGEVRLLESCKDCRARTFIADGVVPGLEIPVTLGPPARVQIVQCSAPTVEVAGSRYFTVTPGPALDPVSLLVEGASLDPAAGCVSLYVQADGRLAPEPFFQLPDTWGTIFVTGSAVHPNTTYRVSTGCSSQALAALSGSAMVTTWVWGDTNGDGEVGFVDIIRIVDGAQGIFQGGTLPEHVDLAPCEPDGVIDDLDVAAGQDAFHSDPFPCAELCDSPSLDDLAEFVACLLGPGNKVGAACDRFDFLDDRDVDLADFAVLQLNLREWAD